MNPLRRFKIFLWSFGHFKVPLIGYLKPKLIKLDDNSIVAKIALNRRSKNHLNSMYFGALAVGADVAGGLHAFYHAHRNKVEASVIFKSFHAQFLQRPESDVYFVCDEGEKVRAMIEESKRSGQRTHKLITINAYTDYPKNQEKVADFTLELSIKAQV